MLVAHYEHAGTLGDLVLQADRVSTAQNIGANPTKALQAPKHSLQHHLLTGLRHLVKNEFKLNQPGAAGWPTQNHLWLVSKTTIDKLRAHLLTQAVDGIPSSNIALFDELQSHGMVESTTEGKAVWNATVTDGDWKDRFTFLRLQPSLIWIDEARPECFTGTVESMMNPTLPTRESSESTMARPQAAQEEEQAGPLPLNQDFDYFDDLIDRLQEPAELQAGPAAGSRQPTTALAQKGPGLAPIEWLREGVRSHRLVISDSEAKVHTVDGTFFLVRPGIFQRYAAEHPGLADTDPKSDGWRRLQRQFEKLDVHVKKPNGQNIWTCQMRGARKISILIREPTAVTANPPADNPFLTLIS